MSRKSCVLPYVVLACRRHLASSLTSNGECRHDIVSCVPILVGVCLSRACDSKRARISQEVLKVGRVHGHPSDGSAAEEGRVAHHRGHPGQVVGPDEEADDRRPVGDHPRHGRGGTCATRRSGGASGRQPLGSCGSASVVFTPRDRSHESVPRTCMPSLKTWIRAGAESLARRVQEEAEKEEGACEHVCDMHDDPSTWCLT